ncbi:hypothetical protein DFJ74DRAFT_763596 [Hyaloraphidium curvatum]|nr:hypothetical protein DFJ74DRAFT_763596 [Hyaloraphidium curvatum]
MAASTPAPAAVGMTGLAWLMAAEQRNKEKALVPFDDAPRANGRMSPEPRMRPPATPLSSAASSPSRPFAEPTPGRDAAVARDLVESAQEAPASPVSDVSRALGPVRTDSSASIETQTALASAVTPKQVSSMMDQSKKVISHLRRLHDEEQQLDIMDADGAMPSYENLVMRLVDKFRNQREVNAANSRLFSLSYVVQMHNYARTRQLMKDVARGKREVMSLQTNVKELEQDVENITVDLEAQKAQAAVFKKNLENTQSLLNKIMVDYRDELNRQREVLRRQQKYLGSMYSAKLSQDLALDMFILIFGVYIVSHPFIRHPLNFLAASFNQLVPMLLRRNESVGTYRAAAEQRGIFLQRLIRIIAFVTFVRNVRELAMGYGLHNKVGAAFSYFTYLSDNVRNRIFGATDLLPTERLIEEGDRKMLMYEQVPRGVEPLDLVPVERRLEGGPAN